MSNGKYDTPSHTHLTFAENKNGRDFIAPDIHGYLEAFKQALALANFDPSIDRVFAVGDLVDRGPESVSCLHLLEEPWFFSVLGNHEQMLINAIDKQDTAAWGLWLSNGGGWSVDIDPSKLELYAQQLMKLPLTITLQANGQSIGICHAQYRLPSWHDRLNAEPAAQQDWLWGRTRLKLKNKTPIQDIDWVFSGHTLVKHSTVLANSVFIETGAYLGRSFNLINLHEWLKAT